MKFCTKCGKPLEEGHTCKKNDQNLFLNIIKEIFIKPIDTIKKQTKIENFNFACILLMVNAITSGILIYNIITESTNFLIPWTIQNTQFLKLFLQGTFFTIVSIITTGAVMYLLLGPISKTKLNFKTIFTMLGMTSIISTTLELVILLFLFISTKLAMTMLLLKIILYLTILYQGMTEITTVNKNKLPYVFLTTITGTLLMTFYILPMLLF